MAALLQLSAAALGVAIWFYFRIEAYLAGPTDGDLYAQSWGFQLVVFGLIWLPLTLSLVGVLISLEWMAARLFIVVKEKPREEAPVFYSMTIIDQKQTSTECESE